ncbi:carbohydrate ABC transporter permease [Streptomyces sp. NPDC002851]
MTAPATQPPDTLAKLPGQRGTGTGFRDNSQVEGKTLNAFSHGFLILWAIMIVLPLIWILLGNFKTDAQISASAWAWPKEWNFDAFARGWEKGVGDYLLNTVIVMAFSVPLTMLFGAMAAYVIARYDFVGNRFFYYFFVAGSMFPVFLALVPLYFMVDRLGMLNTYQGLILVYIAYSMPFTVFYLHSFFRTLPSAVHEAAVIDGASHTRVFFQIMLPMAKPGLVSVGIFNVLGQWNQYILPLTLMQRQSGADPDRSMLAQGLVQLINQGNYETDLPALYAAMTISMVPVLVVYLSFQRQVQSGLTAATIK